MKDCTYPHCEDCNHPDCVMDPKDIMALLKRRRYRNDPEKYRFEARAYKEKRAANLPHCNSCEHCVLVKNTKNDGVTRICTVEMRMIEKKVSNSPQWCNKRDHSWMIGRKEYKEVVNEN